jgi:hypothetical protein
MFHIEERYRRRTVPHKKAIEEGHEARKPAPLRDLNRSISIAGARVEDWRAGLRRH